MRRWWSASRSFGLQDKSWGAALLRAEDFQRIGDVATVDVSKAHIQEIVTTRIQLPRRWRASGHMLPVLILSAGWA
jgi:hypothetical protein